MRYQLGMGRQLGGPAFNGGRRLPLDVIADEEGYTVLANVPGFGADEISLKLEDGILTLRAERQENTEDGSGRALWQERPTGALMRRLQLRQEIDPESIDAWVEDGVLTVRLLKKEEARPHKIEVQGR